jgi:hypothetical protein
MGCCNKGWKYEPPRPITHCKYEEIMITGGEPLLFPDRVIDLVHWLRWRSTAKIFVYTAMVTDFIQIADETDGMTLTLHTAEDARAFAAWTREDASRKWLQRYKGSLRLNIFGEAFREPKFILIPMQFAVKLVEWIKDCPLPRGEVLLKLNNLWTRSV